MIVYGRNAVREALRGKRSVEAVWATAGAASEAWLRGAEVTEATSDELERTCGSPDHQGVCARAEEYLYAGVGDLLNADDALVIALDEVQDPHNLGAVCRVAESAGAAGVVICERRAAQVTAAVCKASAGAVEHLPIARVGNLANWLGEAKAAGAWVYGAAAGGAGAGGDGDGDGEPRAPGAVAGAVAYDVPDYTGAVVLVLGSEGRGLRPRVAGACDQLVSLPQRGRVDSLNVATAAAALVYGILHFRSSTLDKGT